jgi:hypothetical protein
MPAVDENSEQKDACTLPGFIEDTRRMRPPSSSIGFLVLEEWRMRRKGSYTSELCFGSITRDANIWLL